jgi:hypothetical protein
MHYQIYKMPCRRVASGKGTYILEGGQRVPEEMFDVSLKSSFRHQCHHAQKTFHHCNNESSQQQQAAATQQLTM